MWVYLSKLCIPVASFCVVLLMAVSSMSAAKSTASHSGVEIVDSQGLGASAPGNASTFVPAGNTSTFVPAGNTSTFVPAGNTSTFVPAGNTSTFVPAGNASYIVPSSFGPALSNASAGSGGSPNSQITPALAPTAHFWFGSQYWGGDSTRLRVSHAIYMSRAVTTSAQNSTMFYYRSMTTDGATIRLEYPTMKVSGQWHGHGLPPSQTLPI